MPMAAHESKPCPLEPTARSANRYLPMLTCAEGLQKTAIPGDAMS